MDSGAAGAARGQPALSQSDYFQRGHQAASVSSGQFRQVRQVHNQASYIPGSNPSAQVHGTRPSTSVHQRLVKPTPDFNALIKREVFEEMERASACFGNLYDGRKHRQYAISVKLYTSGCKQPLNQYQLNQLIPLLQTFKPAPNWSWRSLTTAFHSFTTAGVFKRQKHTDQVRENQAVLLEAFLNVVSDKGSQTPVARGIDAQGIANLLWAMAKLVDNGLKLIPELKGAVAVLLPHVNAPKDPFNAQGIANLLWAMAKLVDNGHKLTPEIKEAVAALLPLVSAQKANFKPQEIANLLWAMAKLVDNRLKLTPEFKESVAALLPNVQKKQFQAQSIANLLWAMAKLVDNGLNLPPELKEALAALLPLVNAQKANFKSQEIANLLWAMAKLVDNGLNLAEFKKALAALLPLVNAQKANFNPQEIANLQWAMAKLVDNGLELTPKLNEAVTALFPLVNVQKANFNPQEIANLQWAMAKLVDNRLELTPKLNEAVTALLLYVNAQKQQFNAQDIANLLWAMAKLVDNRLELTPELNEALTALLLLVDAQKANFKPQEIASLLLAMAKLVNNGLELTPELKEAVAALLPHVNTQKKQFNAQGIANLLWAMAKLLANGLELTPELKETVAALLPLVNAKKDQFNAQDIANLLWAMAKLLANGLELTPELKETVAALLPLVNTQKQQFNAQDVTNLLWAMAKLGELIKPGVILSTAVSLLHKFGDYSQFTQQNLLMALWGLLACSARLYLDRISDRNDILQQSINQLFTYLQNKPIDSEQDKSTMALAACWLGVLCPVEPHYQTTMSRYQNDLLDQLSSALPSVKIEKEKRIHCLPPVDLLLPEYQLVIEVQGPHHYVGGDFQTRNGSTLLKTALLNKLGYKVIEIPVNKLQTKVSVRAWIDQIKEKVDSHAMASRDALATKEYLLTPAPSGNHFWSSGLPCSGNRHSTHQATSIADRSVSSNERKGSDENDSTVDEGGVRLDEGYFTAEKGVEHQEWKTIMGKRQRRRRKTKR